MLASAPQSQVEEWRAYDRIYPFGTIRGDMQAGIVANMLRCLQGLDPLDAHAYVLDFAPEDRRIMSPEEIAAKLGLWAQAHNANCEGQA
jgi:hypothetical protein